MNELIEKDQIRRLIVSLEHIYQLKVIPRSGWLQAGIPASEVESIASHSFGMAILLMHLRSGLQENGINVERALNMALVHDIAESIVGDITPQDNVPESDKHDAEAKAFEKIVRGVREGEYFKDLWEDFEGVASQEAKVVKRIDKLDMLIQAYLYEKKYQIRLDSFWENMDELFAGSESESIFTYISSNRFEFKGNEA